MGSYAPLARGPEFKPVNDAVDDRRVSRELFPLPLLREAPPEAGRLSHSVAQRLRRRHVKGKRADEVFASLNELYGGAEAVTGGSGLRSAAQAGAQRAVLREIPDSAVPSLHVCREAARELLGSSLGYDGEAPGATVAPYNAKLLSIPETTEQPPEALHVLDPDAAECLEQFESRMMIDEQEHGHQCENGKMVVPYMDTVLAGNATEYANFLHRLGQSGMITFTLRPKDLITPFFVKKKSGQLRVVWDCRGVNARFRSCPP